MINSASMPKPSSLRIEPARPEDAALLSEMVRELAAFEHLEHECKMTEAIAREHLLSGRRHADACIAWLENEAAGFAVTYRTYSTFAAKPGLYLEDLYVRPQYRLRGVGRSLLDYAGSLACARGCGRYEWTTLGWNTQARSLYAKLGARELNEWILLRVEGSALESFADKARLPVRP